MRIVNNSRPVYTVLVKTTGKIFESNGLLHGKCYILNDPNKTEIPFTESGKDGHYTLGLYNGQFSSIDNPNSLDSLTAVEISYRVPVGALALLRVETYTMTSEARDKLVNTLETAATQDKWNMTGISLSTYSIEIAE